jgi:hypothetical protein
MLETEIVDKIKEAYQEGFRDGFEYGTGKASPYSKNTEIHSQIDGESIRLC